MADNALVSTLHDRGFTVLGKLTATGTCTIFTLTANDDLNGTRLAAKVVKLVGLDAQGHAQSLQEVSFLKGIAPHPNLMAYRDSFLDESRLIIVMSLAEDGDLRSVVKESSALRRPIPEPVALSWIRQTLSGLSHMHEQAVLHRDLKSSNIFLSGGRRHLQIGDFGISRMLESTSFAESQVGTPAYMSPEIMQSKPYDYRADMWAVGVICYELSNLRMPFPAATLNDLFAMVTSAEPDWDQWVGSSESLREITRCLLEKDPADRASAADIMAEPLFATAPVVTDEMWAVVAKAEVPDSMGKEALQKTGSTQASTAVGSTAASSSAMVTDQALNFTVEKFMEMHSEQADVAAQ